MSARLASAMIVVLLAPSFALAGRKTQLSEQYRDTAQRLIEAALKDESGYAKLTYLCDRIGPRPTGSEALNRATNWAAEQMKADGLANVLVLPLMVPHWVRGEESGQIIAPVKRGLHLAGLGMSVGTPPEGLPLGPWWCPVSKN